MGRLHGRISAGKDNSRFSLARVMSIILDHVFAKISTRLCLACTNTNHSQTWRRGLAQSVFYYHENRTSRILQNVCLAKRFSTSVDSSRSRESWPLFVIGNGRRSPQCAPILADSNASRTLLQARRSSSLVRLSPQVVTGILQRNEVSVSQGLGPSIGRYDCNQLESNSPVEDRAAEARCVYTTGNLFGVFDGHAGPACAQATSERLFQVWSL